MDDRKREAQRLRTLHGWGYRRIARAVGATRDQVRGWLNPEASQARRRRYVETHGLPVKSCPTCGAPYPAKNKRPCAACRLVASFNRRLEIEERWATGAPLTEIARALDCTRNALGVEIDRMRKAGWSLPYRYRISRAS